MKCQKCGAVLYGESTRCSRCGYSAEDAGRERQIVDRTRGRQKKRLWKYGIGLFLVVSLFYHFFLYIDIFHGCFITIRPALTELSNTTMKKGVYYLKTNFPQQYQDFCSNVRVINPNISAGTGGEYQYLENPDMIAISTAFGKYTDAAKAIIHETCHAMQFKSGRPFSEPECYGKDAIIPWSDGGLSGQRYQ